MARKLYELRVTVDGESKTVGPFTSKAAADREAANWRKGGATVRVLSESVDDDDGDGGKKRRKSDRKPSGKPLRRKEDNPGDDDDDELDDDDDQDDGDDDDAPDPTHAWFRKIGS